MVVQHTGVEIHFFLPQTFYNVLVISLNSFLIRQWNYISQCFCLFFINSPIWIRVKKHQIGVEDINLTQEEDLVAAEPVAALQLAIGAKKYFQCSPLPCGEALVFCSVSLKPVKTDPDYNGAFCCSLLLRSNEEELPREGKKNDANAAFTLPQPKHHSLFSLMEIDWSIRVLLTSSRWELFKMNSLCEIRLD